MKKKWWIVIIIAIIILALVLYFLFFNKTTSSYFGFNMPNFAASASLGDNLEQATDTNAWDNAVLNPFTNKT